MFNKILPIKTLGSCEKCTITLHFFMNCWGWLFTSLPTAVRCNHVQEDQNSGPKIPLHSLSCLYFSKKTKLFYYTNDSGFALDPKECSWIQNVELTLG